MTYGVDVVYWDFTAGVASDSNKEPLLMAFNVNYLNDTLKIYGTLERRSIERQNDRAYLMWPMFLQNL